MQPRRCAATVVVGRIARLCAGFIYPRKTRKNQKINPPVVGVRSLTEAAASSGAAPGTVPGLKPERQDAFGGPIRAWRGSATGVTVNHALDARSRSSDKERQSFPKYKGPMRVIALIDDPGVVRHILEHLGRWAPEVTERGPPVPAADWPVNAVTPLTYHPPTRHRVAPRAGQGWPRLRGARGQHGRLDDAQGFPRPHRAPVRQSAPCVVHGSRRADRGGARADARQCASDPPVHYPRGYTEGPPQAPGAGADRAALARRPPRRAGEAARAGR